MRKLRLSSAPALLFALAAPSLSLAQTPLNLIDDPGFELGTAGFVPNQAGTSVALSGAEPLSGAQSLVVGIAGYGDSVLWSGRGLDGMASKTSSNLTVSMRLRATSASASNIRVCGLVTYADGSGTMNCASVPGSVGDKGLVSVFVPLDAAREISYVRAGLFQEGSDPVSGLLVDDVLASLDGVAPDGGAGGDGGGSGDGGDGGTGGDGGSVPPADSANLIADGGFESGSSGFGPNQAGTSATVVMSGAIAGVHSLSVGMAGYGDSVLWSGRDAAHLSGSRSSNYTVSMRVRMGASSSSALQVCAMASYALNGDLRKCVSVPGSAGDKGTVSVSLPLDSSQDLAGVRLGLFQEGSEPLHDVLIDEASAVLAGLTAVETPAPGPAPDPAPAPDPDPSPLPDADPPPVSGGTAYPGYTYQLPTARPFISLASYDSGNFSSPAYLRLKAQVDDVVAITEALPQDATYEQLRQAVQAQHYGYSAVDSVVMYRLTGDPRYIAQAVRMADAFVASEQARIAAGNLPEVAGDSYLESGFYLEQVALAYDHGYALLSDARRAAWQAYVNQALYNIWHPNAASWNGVSRTWSGWSTHDPGNNYYYSFLKATMLWALATQDSGSIAFLQQEKFTELVPFFSLMPGGGSREGTGYGTALRSMFENYRYWKGSTGEDLAALSSHARDTIDYWLHATVPTLDFFAPIADQSRSSMPYVFDYQRGLMIEAVGLAGESDAASRGAWWLKRAKVGDGYGEVVDGMRYNFDFRFDLLSRPATELQPTALSYEATGAGVVFARSDWTEQASWLHFVAGTYDQSHAHHDQGSFALYRNGWLAVTPNIFSHSGLHLETSAHNVVRFEQNGAPIEQNYGTSTRSVSDAGDLLAVSADLTPVYSYHAHAVQSWTRDLEYRRSTHTLTVHDKCQVGSGVLPVWQLHLPTQPIVQADGSIVAGDLVIRALMPAAPSVNVVDMSAADAEFSGGYRLELSAPGACEFLVEMTAQ